MVEKLVSWFETRPKDEYLARIATWCKDTEAAAPSLSKQEMIENYPSYMLAQVLTAFQVESVSVVNILMKKKFLSERLSFLKKILLGSDDYSRTIAPAIDKLRAQLEGG